MFDVARVGSTSEVRVDLLAGRLVEFQKLLQDELLGGGRVVGGAGVVLEVLRERRTAKFGREKILFGTTSRCMDGKMGT